MFLDVDVYSNGVLVSPINSYNNCGFRCGHKEAVFFQSHSMKAEVMTALSLFAADVQQFQIHVS